MMSEKVSLIIPVYNVEKYLDRCMGSVLTQTYKNLEIILVDDGSEDTSGIMCDQYKLKDDRIIVIHQENKGLSAARNIALDSMTGDYVMFLDSDDKIDEHIVEYLLDDMHKFDCDIVECNFYDVYGSKIKARKSLEYTKKYSVEEAICIDIGTIGGSVSACGKLYKKKIFDEVRYKEGKIGEDGYAIVDVLSKAESVVIDIRPMYYYYHRDNSITTLKFSKANLDHIEAYEYNLKRVENRYNRAKSVIIEHLDWNYLVAIDRILICDDWKDNEYLDPFIRYVQVNRKRMMKSHVLRKTRKVAMLIMLFNRTLYRQIVLMDMKKKYRK